MMRVLPLFFLSGATALVYEVVWSKCLVLIFGSTAQAQTMVLAVFMGGLAMGSRLFGRWSNRFQNPLRAYGWLEIGIGIYGLGFLWIHELAKYLFIGVGSPWIAHGSVLLVLKGGLSVGLLLFPTFLMGGTLPLISDWLHRWGGDAGRATARFYAVNSLGAVVGAGAAGFFLVRIFGVAVTLQLTALSNLLIGVLAIGISRQCGSPRAVRISGGTGKDSGEGRFRENHGRVLLGACLVVTLSGGVSMGLQVLASRMLALLFGGSLQAFATVVMAFILGIGIGATWIVTLQSGKAGLDTIGAGLLLGTAGWVGLMIWQFEGWVHIYRWAMTGVARNEIGYYYHLVLTAATALVVLGVPAGMLGALLPVAMRRVAPQARGLGNEVGWLLTCNTLGAVGGVLFTGFVMMPWLGLRLSFLVLASGLAAAGIRLAWHGRRRAVLGIGSALGLGLALTAFSSRSSWNYILSSGLFRQRADTVSRAVFEKRREQVELLFYEDAADATVTIEAASNGEGERTIGLRVNGKPDASSGHDMATQQLLAHLPFLARPGSKNVFILGLGSGITAGAVLGHPVESVDIAENCAPVVRASQFFSRWNRRPLADRRTRLWQEDGRTVLQLRHQKYDAIISEPSNPWVAGIGSVFSREFYELAAKRLREDGIMVQWFHVYEIEDSLVALLVRTFSREFPHFEIWDARSGDIILVGSRRPWHTSAAKIRTVLAREQPRLDLEALGLTSPARILARQLASTATSFAISDAGPLQTDNRPILEYDAPRAFFIGKDSHYLFQFDERTWLSDLATEEKGRVLHALDEAALRSVFAATGSANTDLERHLELRLRAGHPLPNLRIGGLRLPSIFSRIKPDAASDKEKGTGKDIRATLSVAEESLHEHPGEWRQAVAAISEALTREPGREREKIEGALLARYAALAARRCLKHDFPEAAASLIRSGLQCDPDSPELHYLARLLASRLSGNRSDLLAAAQERPK